MTRPITTLIDWNRNGVFEKPDEDVSADIDGGQVMWWSRGKNQMRQFAGAAAGEFNAVLNNLSRKYSIWNTDSPLSGFLKPGCDIQIETTGKIGEGFAFMDGTDFAFMDGTEFSFMDIPSRVVGRYILDGLPQRVRKEERRVGIPGLGVFSRLTKTSITTRLYQNITTSAAIEVILDAIGWPVDKRNIQAGLTTLAWWYLDKANPFAAIEQLVVTEGLSASWYEDLDGTFVFENRDFRTTDPHSTMPQAVFSDMDWRVQDLEPDANFKDEIKGCRITIEGKEPQPLAPIWTAGADIILTANQVRQIEIRGSGGVFLNAVVPTDVASNTIWKFEGDQTLTEGAFKGEYLGQITEGTLAYNATASDFQDEFGALSTIGASNISFTGGPLNVAPIYGELIGDFEGVNVTTTPAIVESTLNPTPVPAAINVVEIQAGGEAAPGGVVLYEKQRITATGQLASGTWSAEVITPDGTFTTPSLDHDATALEVAEAFADASPVFLPSTEAYFGPISTNPVDIWFKDVLENIDNIVITTTNLMMNMPSATVNVTISQAGGVPDYVASPGSVTSITLSETSGPSTLLTITAGPLGVTLSGLRVRAQTLSVVRSQEITYPKDLTGLEGNIDAPSVLPDISVEDAEMIAETRVLFYENARATSPIRHEVPTTDAAGMDAMFNLQISNMVTVINYQSGLSHNGHIEQLRYEVQGMKLITRIGWEMAA